MKATGIFRVKEGEVYLQLFCYKFFSTTTKQWLVVSWRFFAGSRFSFNTVSAVLCLIVALLKVLLQSLSLDSRDLHSSQFLIGSAHLFQLRGWRCFIRISRLILASPCSETFFRLYTLLTVNHSFHRGSAFTGAACNSVGCLDNSLLYPEFVPRHVLFQIEVATIHLINLLENVLFPRFGFNTEFSALWSESTSNCISYTLFLKCLVVHTTASNCNQ